jgi:hypothetical protein
VIGIGVYLFVTIVIGVVCHVTIRRFGLAVVVASLAAAGAFQAIGCIVHGYLDPFFLLVYWVTALLAVPITALVGLALRELKRSAPQ